MKINTKNIYKKIDKYLKSTIQGNVCKEITKIYEICEKRLEKFVSDLNREYWRYIDPHKRRRKIDLMQRHITPIFATLEIIRNEKRNFSQQQLDFIKSLIEIGFEFVPLNLMDVSKPVFRLKGGFIWVCCTSQFIYYLFGNHGITEYNHGMTLIDKNAICVELNKSK